MTEPRVSSAPASSAKVAEVRRHTRRALGAVAVRLAASVQAGLLDDADPAGDAPLRQALAFAAEGVGAWAPPQLETLPDSHPLRRLQHLANALPGTPEGRRLLVDLVLLACLPQAHEGLATLCRLLHPHDQPWPTVALALRWLGHEAGEAAAADVRDQVEDLLHHGASACLGLLRAEGDGPWHGRTLRAGGAVWPALMARAPAGDDVRLLPGYAQVPGLSHWLDQPEVRQAATALGRGLPCHILLVGGDAAMRHTRGRALLGLAQAAALRAPLDAADPRERQRRLQEAQATAWLYGAGLWLEDVRDEPTDQVDAGGAAPAMGAWSEPLRDALLPVLSSAATERRCAVLDLPQIRLPVRPLAPVARRALWQTLLPQLGEQVPLLAARYPIEPDDARDVVRDLSLRQQLQQGRPLALDEIGACVRARTAWHARPGITRVLPQADWPALLLPPAALAPLQAAVRRITQQITVLDDWGFAQGRDDRRGVRMLFHGTPGTGKTLAAEVMARALGVDLLVVDLASLVSKYIGETEKNLSAVFDVAERSRALLLFDEADALFGKRTDAQDAHDRYANLETAYLLQRLERYEGVAVLTTNLRGQIDKAFTRRFEFIVAFPEPDAAVRQALWRLHLPAAAPLAADVDLAELADWYALSGAQIKNAALAAAFLAAAGGQAIEQRHFLWAVEREFDKAGRAHPGYPPRHAALAGADGPPSHSRSTP